MDTFSLRQLPPCHVRPSPFLWSNVIDIILTSLNARKAMRARSSIAFGSQRESGMQSVKFKEPPPTISQPAAHDGIGVYTETVVKTDADSTRFSGSSTFPFIREKTASFTMTVWGEGKVKDKRLVPFGERELLLIVPPLHPYTGWRPTVKPSNSPTDCGISSFAYNLSDFWWPFLCLQNCMPYILIVCMK